MKIRNRARLLSSTGLFVLDLDGTFNLGDRPIDGAPEFVRYAKKMGKKILFFTNNSSRSSKVYIDRLASMGCPVGREEIMTSGDVTAAYLKRNYPGESVYLVGTSALAESFREEGIILTGRDVRPGIVVVGFDTTLTYEKIERACTFIREGAVFLATHLDINCPVEYGFIPDCGSFCRMITASTGVEPKYLGKPFAETLEMVSMRTGVAKERTAFVGDRLYTDVAAGTNHGARGFLVLSGETKIGDVLSSGIRPDAVYRSLGEMRKLLERAEEKK